jgi:hypothetical protein
MPAKTAEARLPGSTYTLTVCAVPDVCPVKGKASAIPGALVSTLVSTC